MQIKTGEILPLKTQIQTVRVRPTTEDVRKYIYHPAGKIRFRATLEDSVEWPYDSFTVNRIRDGDVILVDRPSMLIEGKVEESSNA